ncbi:MAG: menaquinone biosynthesis protein [Nitrospirae bacterium]|nr:menaquinone biosynthesis protein [Nitrospirota bacterium]MCL5976578.1 menaquinone biosynthesis protein [Nitrospirota bacterium]
MKLRIGKIPYANLFPIFYTLEKECDCSSYEFVEGVPSILNKMLRNDEIDVSPSSSIEYLKNPSLYRIIEGHSISSQGPIESILLFSRVPIGELNGGTIYVSSQSETSVALLDIILREFYGIQCRLHISINPEESEGEAFLLIGDDALKHKARGNRQEAIGRNINKHAAYSLSPIAYSLFIYDLGELWYKKTGLPFVFALWIARREFGDKEELLNKFIKDLNRAKEIAINNFPETARHSPMRAFMSEDEIVSYWNRIDYDLTDNHKEGLELFDKYLRELFCY